MMICESDYYGKVKPVVRLGESGCWVEQDVVLKL